MSLSMHNRPNNNQTQPAGNRFAKNVIKLSTGDLVAQIISLGAVPLISRLYTPGDYGIFSIYLSIVMVLFPVSTLRFNSAIMLPKDRNDAANLLALSILSVICCSFLLIILIGIIIAGGYLPKSWVEKGFIGYIWLMPCGVLIEGSVVSVSFWALRHKMFGDMAMARITQSVADRGLVLGTGYWANAGALYLMLGRIVGPFVSLCFLIRQTLFYEIKDLWQVISLANMTRLARRYREFHLMSSLSFFLNKLARSAPLLVLAMYFPPLEIGFYALSMRVINMPMMLVGNSVSRVFLQRVTGDPVKGVKLAEDTKKIFSYMVCLALPIVIVLIGFGEHLFDLIFGSAWATAGIYTQILAISFLGMFLYRPLSALFDAFECQRARLIFNVFLLTGRVGVVFVGAYLGMTIIMTLLALTATTCLLYVGAYVYLFGLVGVGVREIGTMIIKKVAVMSPIIIGASFSKLLVHDYYILTFIVAGILMFQGLVILRLDPGVRKQALVLMSLWLNRPAVKKQPQ